MVLSCNRCPYRDVGILKGQSQECVDAFTDALVRYSVHGRGKTILHQDQEVSGVYFVCEGSVKLTKILSGGKEVVLDVLTPCSPFAGLPGGKRSTHAYLATTLTELTRVGFIKSEVFSRILASHPTLGVGLSRYLSTRLDDAYRLVGSFTLSARQRLEMVLTRLAALGSKDPSGNGILIPLSHQELAQFAQITPETLSRILRGLKEKKIIRMVKRRLWVVDGESLKKSLEKNDDSGLRK